MTNRVVVWIVVALALAGCARAYQDAHKSAIEPTLAPPASNVMHQRSVPQQCWGPGGVGNESVKNDCAPLGSSAQPGEHRIDYAGWNEKLQDNKRVDH